MVINGYDIITNILSSRLRKLLTSTLSQYEIAFLEGRHILDKALTANEAVDEARYTRI